MREWELVFVREWELVCEWDTQVEKCYILGLKFVLCIVYVSVPLSDFQPVSIPSVHCTCSNIQV